MYLYQSTYTHSVHTHIHENIGGYQQRHENGREKEQFASSGTYVGERERDACQMLLSVQLYSVLCSSNRDYSPAWVRYKTPS